MNKGRMVGGIVCVAAAVFLAALAVALPSDEFGFTVGDTNMPFLPSIVLVIVGVALLATSGGRSAEGRAAAPGSDSGDEGAGAEGGDEAAAAQAAAAVADAGDVAEEPLSEKARLNKQYERMGWGAFLVMLGGFALVPGESVPGGLWSVGLGLIWLGLNGARYATGIKMSLFTTVLGLIALGSGILELAGLNSIGGAVFLIVLGVYVIFKPMFERRGLFGKAEES